MVSYLLGITNVDPIENGLVFERFYNAGRNAPNLLHQNGITKVNKK